VKTAGFKSNLPYQRSYEHFKRALRCPPPAAGGAEPDPPNARSLLLTTHQVKNSHVGQRERAFVVTELPTGVLKSPRSKRQREDEEHSDEENSDDLDEGDIQTQLKSVRAWWVGGWGVDLRKRSVFVKGKERPGATSQR
jgi:hypothetical protein